MAWTKSAWYFNGTNAYAVSAAAVDFSISIKWVIDFWVLLGAATVAGNLLELAGDASAADDRFRIYTTATGKIGQYWKDAGGAQTWESAAQTGQILAHVTAAIDKTAGAKVYKIFINGTASGASTANAATGGGAFANDVLYVAQRVGGTLLHTGNLKNIRAHSFTGTWNDADAETCFHATNVQGGTVVTPGASGAAYTLREQWEGEDAGLTSAANSVGGQPALTLTNVTELPWFQSWAFNSAFTSTAASTTTVDLSAYPKIVFDLQAKIDTSSDPNHYLFTYGTTNQIALLLGSGGLGYFTWTDTGGAQTWRITSGISDNTWLHFTAVMDTTAGAKIAKLLCNGVVSGVLWGNAATGGLTIAAATLRFGRDVGGGNRLAGNIKNLRIHSFTGTWNDADGETCFHATNIPGGTVVTPGASGAAYTLREQWDCDPFNPAPNNVAGQPSITLTNVQGSGLLPAGNVASMAIESDYAPIDFGRLGSFALEADERPTDLGRLGSFALEVEYSQTLQATWRPIQGEELAIDATIQGQRFQRYRGQL